jgi:hypothetical protein
LAASERFPRRQVLLQRRHQEAGPTARAICDRSQLQLGRQQRLQGTEGGPLAWFAIQEVIGHQVVWAVWTDGRLSCDGCWVRGPGSWST